MTKEQLLKIATDRGYMTFMTSSDYHALSHKNYPFILELWTDTNEFLLRYNTGLFVFESGKCGSFDNDEYFYRFERQMITYVIHLLNAEDEIRDRNSKII